jgi:hypothetical protein
MWCIKHRQCESIVQQWLWCVWKTICLNDNDENNETNVQQEPSKYVEYRSARRALVDDGENNNDEDDMNALFPDYSNDIRNGMCVCVCVCLIVSFL